MLIFLVTACEQTVDDRPVAERSRQTMILHDQELADYYHYLSDASDPRTGDYQRAESEYLRHIVSSWAQTRSTIERELNAALPTATVTSPVFINGFRYWREVKGGGQYPVYYRTSAAKGVEVVLDLNQLSLGHDYYQLGDFVISPDARWVAFTEDFTGSQGFQLRVREVGGELLDVSVSGLKPSLAWTRQNSLFYISSSSVFSVNPFSGISKRLTTEKDPAYSLSLRRSRQGEYAILTATSPDSNEIKLITAEHDVVVVSDREPGHLYQVQIHDSDVYILTNKHSPGYDLFKSSVNDLATRTKLSGQDDNVLDFEILDKWIVLLVRENLRTKVLALGPDGTRRTLLTSQAGEEIKLLSAPDTADSLIKVEISGFATSGRKAEIDLLTGLVSEEEFAGPLAKVTERWFTARDGVQVPISLITKDHLAAPKPVLINAYGAYGIVQDKRPRIGWLPLLQRNFAIAHIHVRGGGDLGSHWHKAGKGLNKTTSINDLIDGTRFLVEQGLVDPDQVFVRGASAGAVVIASAVNKSPELFRGVILYAPYLDLVGTLQDGRHWLTESDKQEWGDPLKQSDLENLLTISPYETVTPQDYTPVLVTASMRDNRVPYSESLKWMAKVRHHDKGRHIKLLNIVDKGGHFGPTDQYERRRQDSLEIAFVLSQAGAR